MKQYSLPKGLGKALGMGVFGLIMIVTFAGLADVEIWAFLETHVKPVLGALTFGAGLKLIQNYIKVKFIS